MVALQPLLSLFRRTKKKIAQPQNWNGAQGTEYQPICSLGSAQHHRVDFRLLWKRKITNFVVSSHQKFLTWLSVLPGRRLAISDQRLPISALVLVIKASSSGVHVPFLMLGSATTTLKKIRKTNRAYSCNRFDAALSGYKQISCSCSLCLGGHFFESSPKYMRRSRVLG